MTGVAISYEDPTAPAKVIFDFIKKNEHLKVKCAVLEGKTITDKEVEQLSKLPGKDELRAQLLATMNAPATEFVRLLQAGPVNFLYILQARERDMGE